jgi:hypothetical protein
LLGYAAPVSPSLQANISQTVLNPFPDESIDINNQLTLWTIYISSGIGGVFLIFVVMSLRLQSVVGPTKIDVLNKIDFLFSGHHSLDSRGYARSYPTWLGGHFTIMTAIIVGLLGVLLTLQNTMVP